MPAEVSARPKGRLTVVGTGIEFGSHLAPRVIRHMELAERLLYLTDDPAMESFISDINPEAESLATLYAPDLARQVTYARMVERILSLVRSGFRVCVAAYGHPGVLAFPTHEAVKRAREEGFDAQMLPAVSAEDCMFADLGVDPGESGAQSFEAMDFLIFRRRFDPSCALILWQPGAIGEFRAPQEVNRRGLEVLVDVLLDSYPSTHETIIYEASRYSICRPFIEKVALGELAHAAVSLRSLLYVPPSEQRKPDLEIVRRLGLRVSA